MDIESFIGQKEFKNLDLRLKDVQDELRLNSYNLFTVSSYNSYLENFHSDVISILLDPSERHKQENIFLDLFLDFLTLYNVQIVKSEYALCEVTREQGRIDIWIKDNTSKKSIIIENKINNAGDQENQLENYYHYAKNRGFEIDTIIYLTLNEEKRAPISDIVELNKILRNIPAFTNTQYDLCNGWLLKCYENSKDEDNRSFIFQYLKLIKHLSQTGMDKKIKDDFYTVINKDDGYRKMKVIEELVKGLEQYRSDLLGSRIGNDYLPFKKMIRYRPNHWLFENYNDNGTVFKLDVYFTSDGSARIDFWNPGQPYELQQKNTTDKMRAIGLYDEFESGGPNGGKFKIFSLEKHRSIQEIDNKLYDFVKQFFEKLR